jgi:hypothetical protein
VWGGRQYCPGLGWVGPVQGSGDSSSQRIQARQTSGKEQGAAGLCIAGVRVAAQWAVKLPSPTLMGLLSVCLYDGPTLGQSLLFLSSLGGGGHSLVDRKQEGREALLSAQH